MDLKATTTSQSTENNLVNGVTYFDPANFPRRNEPETRVTLRKLLYAPNDTERAKLVVT